MLISADWFTSWIHKRLIMRCVRSSLIFLRAFGHALLVPTTPVQPKFNCFTYTDTHAHQHVRATAFATSFFFFAKRRSCYTQCAQYIFFLPRHNNAQQLHCTSMCVYVKFAKNLYVTVLLLHMFEHVWAVAKKRKQYKGAHTTSTDQNNNTNRAKINVIKINDTNETPETKRKTNTNSVTLWR